MPGIEDFLRKLDDDRNTFISLFTRHKLFTIVLQNPNGLHYLLIYIGDYN